MYVAFYFYLIYIVCVCFAILFFHVDYWLWQVLVWAHVDLVWVEKRKRNVSWKMECKWKIYYEHNRIRKDLAINKNDPISPTYSNRDSIKSWNLVCKFCISCGSISFRSALDTQSFSFANVTWICSSANSQSALYDCDRREIYWINIFKKKQGNIWEIDSIINTISARKKETNSNCIHLEWIKRESYIFEPGMKPKLLTLPTW